MKVVFTSQMLFAAWLACGCVLGVLGDNLDPVASHRMGPGYAVVFTSLTVEREVRVGFEVFALHDEGAATTRRVVLAARRGTEVVAAYLRPGKYELGGLRLENRGGSPRSLSFARRRRDDYSYFEVSAGACNWIGDYVIDASAARGARVSQLSDEQSFAAASAAFRGRFSDLAGRCSLRNALITR